MRIPKIFIPSKNLEKKTEKLVEGYREITQEELMKDKMKIIHGNSDDFQRVKNIEDLALKVVNDTFSKKLTWKEYFSNDPLFSKSYETKAVIHDYKQEPIIVQVLFRISETKTSGTYGYLYLGNEQGLCMNAFIDDEKIQELINEYFK